MFQDITKDDILHALKGGNVSCNLKGDISSFDPKTFYGSIIQNLDKILENQIDFSFEKKFEEYLNKNNS